MPASMGLPVVVSMGAVAASGGYYIAAEADEIWATPSTITGSIGVFAAFPTFEELLQRVGVYTDGVGTTNWRAHCARTGHWTRVWCERSTAAWSSPTTVFCKSWRRAVT